MGKKISKAVKSVTGATIGKQLIGSLTGQNAQQEAERAREAALRQQEQMDQQSRLIQQNMSADLRGENLTEVVAGGSADVAGDASTDPRKRRRAGGLSSSLGIV